MLPESWNRSERHTPTLIYPPDLAIYPLGGHAGIYTPGSLPVLRKCPYGAISVRTPHRWDSDKILDIVIPSWKKSTFLKSLINWIPWINSPLVSDRAKTRGELIPMFFKPSKICWFLEVSGKKKILIFRIVGINSPLVLEWTKTRGELIREGELIQGYQLIRSQHTIASYR